MTSLVILDLTPNNSRKSKIITPAGRPSASRIRQRLPSRRCRATADIANGDGL